MKLLGFHFLLCDTCATSKLVPFNKPIEKWLGRCGVLTIRNFFRGGCRGRVIFVSTVKLAGETEYPDMAKLAPLVKDR